MEWDLSLEINIYIQLIFNTGSKNIKVGKSSLFSKWCWENQTAACKSMKAEHTLTPCTQINSKWLINLNIRHDTTKFLEETIGKTFSNIKCINVLLGQFPKTIEIKTKINKWDPTKLMSCGIAKETIKKKQTTYSMGENICK